LGSATGPKLPITLDYLITPLPSTLMSAWVSSLWLARPVSGAPPAGDAATGAH
jgi:hypothetical protein